jgi:hypothetical protein
MDCKLVLSNELAGRFRPLFGPLCSFGPNATYEGGCPSNGRFAPETDRIDAILRRMEKYQKNGPPGLASDLLTQRRPRSVLGARAFFTDRPLFSLASSPNK